MRSFGLMPEPISHDWHVQPSCQRPNRDPPRRREFSPGESTRMRIRLSSKLDKHTGRRKSRQSSLPTEFPDDFHIGNLAERDRRAQWNSSKNSAQPYGLPIGAGRPISACFLRSPNTEDKKLRKDPLEVLALKVPFGNVVAFRMKSRGRDN